MSHTPKAVLGSPSVRIARAKSASSTRPTGGFESGNELEKASRGKTSSFEGPSGRFGGCGDTLTSQASRRCLGWQTVDTRF